MEDDSGHSDEWREGFDDGYAWFMQEKKKGFIAQVGGFGIEDIPYRSGDDEYNAGVRDGIEEARSR